MIAKLIKTNSEDYHMGHYFLNNTEGFALGSTDYEWCRRVGKSQYKLSKQNCDELFGVVDLDKLAKDFVEGEDSLYHSTIKNTYMHGFLKAMELNKDKLFTLEDVLDAWELGASEGLPLTKAKKEKLLKSIQPTEIEVEVVMESEYIRMGGVKGVKGSSTKLSNPAYGCKKTDENGCLILKKI